MPVAAVARQARCLNGQDGAHPTLANRRQQPFEAWLSDPAARASKHAINGKNIVPPELVSPFNQTILTPPALAIVRHLVGRRLPNIDDRASRQMLSRDPRHRRPPATVSSHPRFLPRRL